MNNKLKAVLVMTGAALLFAALFFIEPREGGFYPPCMWKTLTGLNCSGCGSTRAMYKLLHLDIVGAMKMNAFAVLMVPVLAYVFVAYLLELILGRKVLPMLKTASMPAILILVMIILFMILRNIPVYPFNLLSPH